MTILWKLIDRKTARILNILISRHTELFHIQKLSDLSKVPLGTTFRIVNKLVKLDILESVPVGKFKVYRLKDEAMIELASEMEK